MKKLIIWLLVLALLLCGCAADTEEPASTAVPETTEATEETQQATPQRKDESEGFGLSYLPAYGVNPFTCSATVNRALISLLYEGLFTVNNQFRAEPVLCESQCLGHSHVVVIVSLGVEDIIFL